MCDIAHGDRKRLFASIVCVAVFVWLVWSVVVAAGGEQQRHGGTARPTATPTPSPSPTTLPPGLYDAQQRSIPYGEFGWLYTGGSYFEEPVDCEADRVHLYVLDRAKKRVSVLQLSTLSVAREWQHTGMGETDLLDPVALTLNNTGEVLIADYKARRIKVYTRKGSYLRSIVPEARNGEMALVPTAIATDSSDNIYVADALSGNIMKLDYRGKLLRRFALGSSPGKAQVRAIEVVNDAYVYVVDSQGGRITRITLPGGQRKTIPGEGAALDDLKYPRDVAVSPENKNIYIAESGKFRISVLDTAGERYLTTLRWLDAGKRPMAEPLDVAFDPAGNLFVIDRRYRRIFKIKAPNLGL